MVAHREIAMHAKTRCSRVRSLTMKAARMSRMRVMGCTGSLQNSDSMKCCSRRCLNTRAVGGASAAFSGPHPNLCATGGRTCHRSYTCQSITQGSCALW